MARLGQQDFLPKQRMLRAQSDLRAVEKEVRSVGAAMERLNTKARLNGGDFSAQQRQVAEAQASLFRALKDGRRTNFTAELNQLRRSEEHTSELQSLMRISYAVLCL